MTSLYLTCSPTTRLLTVIVSTKVCSVSVAEPDGPEASTHPSGSGRTSKSNSSSPILPRVPRCGRTQISGPRSQSDPVLTGVGVMNTRIPLVFRIHVSTESGCFFFVLLELISGYTVECRGNTRDTRVSRKIRIKRLTSTF